MRRRGARRSPSPTSAHLLALSLSERWREIGALELVRGRALRLMTTHPLRAADAVQLAVALVAWQERPPVLSFVCVDDRLRESARKEGFPVLPP